MFRKLANFSFLCVCVVQWFEDAHCVCLGKRSQKSDRWAHSGDFISCHTLLNTHSGINTSSKWFVIKNMYIYIHIYTVYIYINKQNKNKNIATTFIRTCAHTETLSNRRDLLETNSDGEIDNICQSHKQITHGRTHTHTHRWKSFNQLK